MSQKSSKVAWLFAPHIANTTGCETRLHRSISLAKDANIVMSEFYFLGRVNALDTLRDIEFGLKATAEKAKKSNRPTTETPEGSSKVGPKRPAENPGTGNTVPIAQLERVVSDYKKMFRDITEKNQWYMDSAWKAWKDATMATVIADLAVKEHSDTIVTLQEEVDAREDLSQDEKNDAANIKSALESQNRELRATLDQAVQMLQSSLTYTPSSLSDHGTIWGREYKKVEQTFVETGALIANAEAKKKGKATLGTWASVNL